jgi:hypothetical protein
MKTLRKNLMVAAIVALALPAFGDAVFTLGNNPQPNEQNVLFTTDQTGSPVFGFTNQSNDQVQFSSTTDTLVVTSSGQAKVSAMDGLVNDITFTVPGHTFLDFILNPFKPAANNDLLISVTMSDGSTFNYGPYGGTNGNNFLTITTINGEAIASVTIDSAGGFQDLRQPRVSGVSGAAVPEPSSLLLLGSSVLGLATVLRRKASQTK